MLCSTFRPCVTITNPVTLTVLVESGHIVGPFAEGSCKQWKKQLVNNARKPRFTAPESKDTIFLTLCNLLRRTLTVPRQNNKALRRQKTAQQVRWNALKFQQPLTVDGGSFACEVRHFYRGKTLGKILPEMFSTTSWDFAKNENETACLTFVQLASAETSARFDKREFIVHC